MSIQVESQPEGADVYVQSQKKLKKVGVTPVALSSDDIGENNINIVIKKEGFEPHTVLFEKRALSAQAEIYAELNPSTNNPNARGMASVEGSADKNLDRITRTVASIQSQLLQNNYQSAEGMAQDLVNEFPYNAVAWNLLGNAFYLQNRQQEALQAYYKAMEFDPNNQETQNLINKLENKPTRSNR